MTCTRLFGLALSILFLPIPAFAQDDAASAEETEEKKDDWNVAEPGGPYRELEFETDEGAWICVDVHPDGKSIVFDLLGDLYTLPIEGGTATPLLEGMPYEIQPRWSPDGKKILFTSDRGGGDNLWVVDADGSNPQQLTEESFRLLNNGTWHPNGEYVVARKHFTSTRSLGAGELWIYRVPNSGSGVQLTEKRTDQKDAGEPEFSPDGRFLYWSEDMTSGSSFEYNKDPNGTVYVIRCLEMETGEIRDVIRRAGGAVRPQMSPDGKTLAFIRRDRAKTVLSLFDLESGEIRDLWNGLSKDQQETWAVFGVYPGFDWTPDGRSIVLSASGHLHRVDVATGIVHAIPFKAQVKQRALEALQTEQSAGAGELRVRVVRWIQFLDRSNVIFQALGYLYTANLEDGATPRRITSQTNDYEFAPALSPDRTTIAYVTWNDVKGGTIRTVGVDGSNEQIVVSRPGHYSSVDFSPDGKTLVYRRGSGDRYRGELYSEDSGIYTLDLDAAGPSFFLGREGKKPRFNHDGTRINLISREDEKAALISVNRLGSDRRVHATSEHAVEFRISPDGRHLAFEELWNVYVVPFPPTAVAIELSPKMKSLPIARVSEDAGTDLAWSRDGKILTFSLGAKIFGQEVAGLFEKDGEPNPNRWDLSWSHEADIPGTDLYLVGATIVPMHDRSVIENGVVHVKGNRIAKVGTRAEVTIPRPAKVIDVTGKTILPGFVDTHAHTGSSNQRIYSRRHWGFLANLAFGVTATHDPSNNSQMIFALGELRNAGMLIAPRIYSTGTILYGAEGNFKAVIDSIDDARQAVRRTKAWGAFSVKSYNQPRREQRQMVIQAAREEGMLVMPEGGSTFHHNMTMFLDGHTTIEHAIPIAPLYDPELRLLSDLGTTYTPTLVVGYGGLWGENYWYQKTDVWQNERLLRFVPRSVVEPRSRRRMMVPDEEFHHIDLAKVCAEVVRRGGNVTVGAHGQMQGIAVHWEMWMFEQGGMSPHEALRAGTFMGAKAIGMEKSFGSLQEGLLADLVVLEGNPLRNVRDSEKVLYTMINGRLYHAETMEQIEPARRVLPKGPSLEILPISSATGGCSCHVHTLVR